MAVLFRIEDREHAALEFGASGHCQCGKRGSRARVLAGASESSRVELWEWHLKYGDPYDAPAHARGTRELIYVVAGVLSLTIGEEKIRGEAGETVMFHANRPHRYAAADRDGCHLIMTVLEAPGEKVL